MIHLRRHMVLLLFLLLCALLSAPGTARAADTCTADRLKAANVTTTAEFFHRGGDVSSVVSITDITVPPGWEQAPHLFLDAHAAEYRDALRCLLGKGASAKETEDSKNYSKFYDYEWRFRPVSVRLDEGRIAIHYEAVAWVQDLEPFYVGLWKVTPGKNEWEIELKRPASLGEATWENVRVGLGGPGALSAWPPMPVGEGRGELIWTSPRGNPYVAFRPPAAQKWNAIVQSDGQGWQALGAAGASGAFTYFATGALSLIAGNRLRRGFGRNALPVEEKALAGLRSWALILFLLGIVFFMGDDLCRFLRVRFGWRYDYQSTVALFSIVFIGVVLCFFGALRKPLLAAVCVLVSCLFALYVGAELSHIALVSSSDVPVSHLGEWLVVMASAVPIFVCCLGVISAGQRLLLLDGRGLSQWVMVSFAAAMTGLMLLWARLAFDRSWERRTWLTDFAPSVRDSYWLDRYDWWWQWFASDMLRLLGDTIVQLAPLALVGVLRVCRVEQYENDSFTPSAAEKSFLVIFFAAMVVPNYAVYFGFSAYVTTLILGIFAAWAVLALGQSRAVLEQPTAGNVPLGEVISRNDRSELLRLAHRYRELQSRLHHPGTGSPAERSTSHEVIEQEIDRLDQCLPEGVRPIDLPFAFGPMSTWWGNACRCALIACFIGLPATGVMYWLDVVRGDSWSVTTEDVGGFLRVVYEIVYWQLMWVTGGFFLGALWRDLPGRNGPMKSLAVAAAFAVPIGVHEIIAQMIGQGLQNTVPAIAAFASVLTFSGLAMDIQTFKSERRYRSSNASLLVSIYQMRFASVAFLLAQLVALATLWQSFTKGGPSAPPPTR